MVATARKRPKTRHERLLKQMGDRRKAYERSGKSIDLTSRLKKSDYRYWMLVRAGIFADHDPTYHWWCKLHWMQREAWFRQNLTLLCISESDIDETTQQNIDFFRNALKR